MTKEKFLNLFLERIYGHHSKYHYRLQGKPVSEYVHRTGLNAVCWTTAILNNP